jgi:hypothetical protein
MTGAEDFGKKEGGRCLSEIFTGVNEHLPLIHQDHKTNGLADYTTAPRQRWMALGEDNGRKDGRCMSKFLII